MPRINGKYNIWPFSLSYAEVSCIREAIWECTSSALKKKSRNDLVEAIHGGECGAHMNSVMLARKILMQGYYWSTMEEDCINFVRRCHKCQIHANCMNIPPSKLYNMTSPWPFLVWGIDFIRAVSPKGSNRPKFILVAIDYFTKSMEA